LTEPAGPVAIGVIQIGMKKYILLLLCSVATVISADHLPHTKPLKLKGDLQNRGEILSAQMVTGIDKYFERKIKQSVDSRRKFWNYDHSKAITFKQSTAKNRERFRFIIGATDDRLPIKSLQLLSTTSGSSQIYDDQKITIHSVRWPVFKNVNGAGLLLIPKVNPKARVIAIPDADQTPEQIAGLSEGIPAKAQFARRLAEAGCVVVIPGLIDRRNQWSGDNRVALTNQTHREWIYRQAFQMGRHIIGYEVQKILSVVDWFDYENGLNIGSNLPIGVAGYGEGGLISLYAGALDSRINSVLTSGYFNNRQRIWAEPIYRNVFGLLEQFGDAEIASLIGTRALVVEHAPIINISGPPKPEPGRRAGAAPGIITTPNFKSVAKEFRRAKTLAGRYADTWKIVKSDMFGNDDALGHFLKGMGVLKPVAAERPITPRQPQVDNDARQKRQVEELVDHTQLLLRFSEYKRSDKFWKKLPPGEYAKWAKQCDPYRHQMQDEVIGKLPTPNMPINPRSKKILETKKWTAFDVVLDTWEDVYAWGIILLPKDIKAGEKRPVVVCQHGLEGLPMDTITKDPKTRAFQAYSSFSAELADRGFVVFAPHNPYRGRDLFRVLQRKANPLGKSLFSVIVGQHERIIDWLETLPYVDKNRIGFYGLSYGGKTAMRVPALIPRYCLSICSADFNEWIKKNTTVDTRYSYMFTGEYEMFEYNLGNTFNYAEMGALIAPRPFMVERGHRDGVAPDEWVAYEYAKIRRLYGFLGIPERTEIEFFNGPHKINGVATYKFLHRHLNWPLNK